MGSKSTIHIGDTIGRFTVRASLAPTRDGRSRWLCRCECGAEDEVTGKAIRDAARRPCPHARRAAAAAKRAEREARRNRPRKRPEKRATPARAEPVTERPARIIRPTARTLALYNALPEAIREAVDRDIEVRLAALRKHKIGAGNLDQLYIEAIQIAEKEAQEPPPVAARERFEPFRSYGVYQSPKGAA